nr:hypothetical protein [Tanacetum cinerariifolium]
RALEFQAGDHVFLKVSPARGVRRFGIKSKLSPRFIGPFEILDRVGELSFTNEILRKFGLIDGKSASTPIDTEKPLLKDPDGEDVDVHTYRFIFLIVRNGGKFEYWKDRLVVCPQVVSAAKLPILNHNEFDLWKMRIEQYFLMTDYSLWEVILNGDAPLPTKVIEGVVQPLTPTTTEQCIKLKFNIHKDAKTLMDAIKKRFGGNKDTKKVQKTLLKKQYKNFTGSSFESLNQIHDRLQKLISQLEILGESLSQEDINLKFIRSLPVEWRTHTLIWRNKTDLEDQSLDDLFISLKIYEADVKSSSSASSSTQNIAFVSSQNTDSTNESVSAVASVFAASAKVPVSALPNVDTLGDAVIYSFFASQSNSPHYNWSFQTEEEPINYALMAFTSSSSSSSSGFDNEVASYSKACTKAYATLQSYYDKLTNDLRKSQFDVISYKTGLESIEARLLIYQQNETVFEEDIKLLKLDVELRDNALVVLRQKFEKAEQEIDELKLKLEKFQTSSKNLSQLLASQTNDKTRVGYDNQVFTSSMFDCDEMFSSETNKSLPASPIYDRYQSGEGYHAVPPPYKGTFMPPKPDLAFCPLVEDWVSDSEDDSASEPKHTQISPSFVQPIEHIKPLRPFVKPCEHPIPADHLRKDFPKSKGYSNSRNRKACFVCKSLTHLIKDYDYYEKQMVQKPAMNHAQRGNHQQYSIMTHPNPQRHVVPTAILTRSKLVSLTAIRPVTTAVPYNNVIRQRPAKPVGTKLCSPPRRTINRRPSPPASNFPPKVTTVKAPKINVVKGVQRNWVWKPKCLILDHVSRNTSASMTLKKFDYTDALGRSKTKELKIVDAEGIQKVERSQMCDKKNSDLFTNTKCIVLSPEFKLPDENQVLLKVPRKDNMYNVDLKNIVPSRDLTCLFAKATLDKSNLWHRRLGYINFKTMNKLVKGNLVRGLPSKVFKNHHTCVACKKGKQHRASYKTKPVSLVSQPLQRSDNGTEFKNQDLNQLCGMKGIKREFSVPRTPQQNGIAKRKNMTLIKADRTMLASLLLPISFWAEVVNTAYYVQNKVLVTKPHNKTPYELLLGRTPSIGFMRPFGCPVTILNTLDPLGKFDGKADEGFLIGYSISSKAFRVFNSRTRIVQETLHINFLENKPNVAGSGPTWLFDIDTLTKSMNYQPVTAGNQSIPSAGVQKQFDAEKARKENVQQYVRFPLWSSGSKDPQNTDGDPTFKVKELVFEVEKPESKVHVSPSSSAKTKKHDDKTKREAKGKIPVVGKISTNSTNTFSAAGPFNTTVNITFFDDEEDVGVEADFTNLETTITVSPIPTTRVHKYHHATQIIGDLSLATQTRSMTRMVKDQGGLTQINNEDFHTCMFDCFLSQEEPKRVHQALKYLSWIEAMQEELLQFKMQKVWVLVDLPNEKRAIGTEWVFRNKKDERGIVVRNKTRLVVQGHTQEGGINYEEFFAPVVRIEAIRLFLAYASFMGFMVYQMDVKSAFLYGTIKEEVYVYQPPRFEDPDYPDKVYKVRGKIDQNLFIKKQKGDILLVQVYVDDIIFGSTNKDLCKAFKKLMKDKFQMSFMGELTFFFGIQVKQNPDEIFISHDKYVAEILRKFGLADGKSASTPIDTEKPLLKDPNGEDVDIHTYRLISWQCKKQTIVATSSTEAEYVAAASCYASWKKVIITEDKVREALRLDNAESIDCLPNEEIFTVLEMMGYEKPSPKLAFYKAFFSAQ